MLRTNWMLTVKRMNKTVIHTVFPFILLMLLSGCASMYAPSSDNITINTIPQGAKVYDGVNLLGTTPLTHTFKRVTLERKTLTLRKDGYKTQDLLLGTTLDPKAFWNFAFISTTFGVTS